MSRELETWAINAFSASSAVTDLLAKDSSGIPAIFSYHHRDVDERTPYPQVTLARFGSHGAAGEFEGVAIEGITRKMDDPRIALCVWSTVSVDECWKIYDLLDDIMRGKVGPANTYFGSYRINRTTLRDDLWDDVAKAFHLHAEYSVWLSLTNISQP